MTTAMNHLPFALFEELTIHTIYTGCAVLGGTVLTIQLLLLLFGGDVADGEVDIDGDADGLSFFSIRAVAAFLTFFGLVGILGREQGWSSFTTAGAALGSGLGMMAVVAWLLSLQSKLFSEGTLDPAGAVGKGATVYLRIPGGGDGKGKITVALQGRTAEYAAVTDGPELPTGADVVVVEQIGDSTFRVERA